MVTLLVFQLLTQVWHSTFKAEDFLNIIIVLQDLILKELTSGTPSFVLLAPLSSRTASLLLFNAGVE
jgi:hypothetical protein